MKASYKTGGLFGNTSFHAPLHHALNIFLLVLLRHRYVLSVSFQLTLCHLTKHLQRILNMLLVVMGKIKIIMNKNKNKRF